MTRPTLLALLVCLLFAPVFCPAHEGHSEPRSPHWPKVRAEYLAKHPTCEACGGKTDLNVHHCLPYHLRHDLELEPRNLITLCRVHHEWIGHSGNWKAYNPHVREDAALMLKRIKERKYE